MIEESDSANNCLNNLYCLVSFLLNSPESLETEAERKKGERENNRERKRMRNKTQAERKGN